MNNPTNSQTESTAISPGNTQRSQKMAQVKFLLEPEIYQEIDAALTALSLQSDVKITMAKFLRRIVLDNWKPQLERFRRLHVEPKRSKI